MVVASLVASFVVSTVQLPGVERNIARAAGSSSIDSYATFNGSGQLFWAANATKFNFTTNMTLSAWIRPNASCFSNRNCIIVSKADSYIFGITDGRYNFAFWNSSTNTWAWQGSPTTKAISGQWQHISFVKSGTSLTMYLNGTNVYTNGSVVNSIGQSTWSFRIGNRTDASGQDFVGDIDEVRIFSTARTAAEVLADMNTWGPANTTGLELYYDFNEGAGTTLSNTVSGAASGTHLTAVGSPTWSDVKKTTNQNNRQLVAFPRPYLTSVGGYTVPGGVTSYHYLVVAGGGGGGSRHGGGGGAGGYLTAVNQTVSGGDVLGVVAGGGGIGAADGQFAKNGADSVLTRNGSVVAQSLGGGRGEGGTHSAANGGSGGGAAHLGGVVGRGTAGQGYDGGLGGSGNWACTGNYSGWCGGGGGGAGSAGEAADGGTSVDRAGNGGVGLASSLLDTTSATALGIGHIVNGQVFFAGGGGGGVDPAGTRGVGGNGGGGAGSAGTSGGATTGTATTGGGGGGGGYSSSGNDPAGAGGSGVVLLSFALPCTITTSSLADGSTQVVVTNPAIGMSCTYTWSSPAGVSMVDALIVGAGGGGGGASSDSVLAGGGGGGAGGQVKRLRSQAITPSTNYTVTVGGGGAAGVGSTLDGTAGLAGSSSSAFSNTSSGGGGGGGSTYNGSQSTNSGDGGSTLTTAGGTQSGGSNDWEGAGGGAGAGSPGVNGRDGIGTQNLGYGESGGNGQLVQWFPGSCSAMFGGGGGGGGAGSSGSSGSGGPGGGGNAATNSAAAVAGADGCGGGGGGGYANTSFHNGARGGNGVVAIQYNYTWGARTFTTGTVTVEPKSSSNMGLGTNQVQYYTNGEVVSVRLTSTNGVIGATASGSASVSGNNSTSVTITGSQIDVNNTLNAATLTTDNQGPGQVTMRISAAAQNQTINGLTFRHSNGHFYAYRDFGSASRKTIGQAAEDALNYTMGGRYSYLATVTNSTENSFLTGTVRAVADSAWIGLTDDVVENNFEWKAPDAIAHVSTGNSSVGGMYTNWPASGEPNNSSGLEDYGHYVGNGTWNDNSGTATMQYAFLEVEPLKTKEVFNINYSLSGQSATVGKSSRIETPGGANPIPYTHFTQSETVSATVSVPAGSTISLTTTGNTVTSGSSGSASVTFEGTVGNVNTALATLTLTPGSAGTTTVTVTYRAKQTTTGNYKYNATTGTYYLLGGSVTYATAVSTATSQTFGGVQGYLVTVQSDAERTFITNNVTSGQYWANGRDQAAGGDETTESQWVMDGGDAYTMFSSEASAIDGSYVNWTGSEPSNGSEGCLNANFNTNFWNDADCSASIAAVYEFKPYSVTYSIPVTVTAVGSCSTSTTTSGKYTLQQVTATGHCNWTVPAGVTAIDAFVQGAGGGGGADSGSGGNGGTSAIVQGRTVTAGGTVNVYVGEGGMPAGHAQNASLAGEDTFITLSGSTLTAAGGPGGLLNPGAGPATASAAGIGFSGGLGGTGASSNGSTGAAGKTGTELWWSGSSVQYGGGGGGGSFNGGTFNLNPAAGTSGGGNGCDANTAINTAGSAGTPNRGGGGGAGCAGDGGRFNGGIGGSGTVIFRYATDPLDAFPASIGSLRAFMTADSFQYLDSSRRSWIDTSGNSRHASTFVGSPSVTTVTGNGATETVRTLTGATTDGLRFPTGLLSDNATTTTNDYTLLHVARYSGSTRRRIFDAVSSNWLSGFWDGNAGVAYHNKWVNVSDAFGTQGQYNHTNWLLSVDQMNSYRANGGEAPNASTTGASRSNDLSINYGYFHSNNGMASATERSDWNVAEVIVFSKVLTAAEIRQVESYLVRKYGLTGVNTAGTATLPLTPKALATSKTGITASDRLYVSWATANDTTGVTDYKLEYKKSTDSSWTIWSHTASASYLSDTVTGLLADTQYDFRVTAVDSGASNRPSTAVVTGTTKKTSAVTLTPPASPRKSQGATITAAVTATATGTVTFLADGSNISGCVNVAVSSNAASCSWTPSSIGSASLTATYSGDTAFATASTASASSVTVSYRACAPTTTVVGRFTVSRFTDSTDTCDYAALPTGVESVDVLVVGGGGGGGENVGSGGGGGGGYDARNLTASSTDSFRVTVGAGGRAGIANSVASTVASADRDGGVGADSTITWNSTTLTGVGGGAGQTAWSDEKCSGSVWNTTRPSGGTGSGMNGTSSVGGRGGIGDRDGATTTFTSEAGEAGFTSDITGTTTSYGGGGGGGGWGTNGGAGGAGGGGAGGTGSAGATGTANTGGGGGGGAVSCSAGGAGGSGMVIMRYANVPLISTQPVSQTVAAGTSSTFSVSAAATGATLTYQWQRGGVNISGATSASYTISSPVVADAGNYRVVVRNTGPNAAVSSVTSSAATFTVNVASQTITFGSLTSKTYGDASFSVSATASSGLPVTITSNSSSVCTVTSSTVTIAGAGTCSLTASQAGDDSYNTATPVTQTFTVDKKTLTLSGLEAANKTYDRSTTATVSFNNYSFGSSVVGSDVVTLSSGSYLATFGSASVATGATVTVTGLTLSGAHAGNYHLPSPITTTANITTKELTVAGITANNKTYNGNTTASLIIGTPTLNGAVSGDNLTLSTTGATGAFRDENVGTAKIIDVSGLTFSGTGSANYTLTQPTTSADITAKDLVVSGITAANKTYDDNTGATLVIGTIITDKVSGDLVTVNTGSAAGTFASKNVATGITVQVSGVTISGGDASNYNLLQPTTVANIAARAVTVTGITANTREYDRTTTATLNYGSAVINNVAGNDALTLSTGSVTATFNDKTVATGKAVTVTGLAVSGSESANYSVTQPTYITGVVTAKELTVNGLTATNKVYDGNNAAAFTGTAALVGKVGADAVTIDASSATATFDNKNFGSSKVVSVTGVTIGGGDSGNYTLTQPTLSANITKKELTVTGLTGNNKVYDRTTTASFSGTAGLSGVVGSEVVTVSTTSATASFATKSAENNKVVSVTGVTFGGGDSGNYTLTQPTLSANITTAPLTMSGVTANSKTYNGNTTASLSDGSAALSGVIGQDAVTLEKAGASATFADANVANSKAVTVLGYSISGGDSGNYLLSQPTGLTANITAAGAGLTWSTPSAITYGTLLSSTQLNATASVSGTFTYTPALNTLLAAGTHTLSVTFTPDSGNYAASTTTVSLTVNKKTLNITASSATVAYGDGRPTITASFSGFITGENSSNLTTVPTCTTTYTSTTPVASSGVATTCSGAASGNYSFNYVNGAVTINKKTLIVTASSPSRSYGDARGTITPSYSNDFVNGDTSAVVSGMSCSTTYGSTSAAGTTHATYCNSGTADSYQLTYVDGSITVAKKIVAVTASSHTVSYGDASPTVTASYGTFANGDTSSVVSNTSCGTSYVVTTPVASSGIATSCSGATANNYQFTYTAGAITINKKTLTTTASSHTVIYGDVAPSPTPNYSGFVNSENATALTTAPTCTTSYVVTTPVASSGIATSCSGGVAANYAFSYVNGAISISRKGIVVTASSTSVLYGAAIPTITPSYSNDFVNDDTSSVVSGTNCSTTYTTTSNVGTTPSTSCSGAMAANYSFAYSAGSVIIGKRTLTVTASSPSVAYGTPVNSVTVSPQLSGFVNSETSSVIDTTPTCSTPYSNSSAVGSSPSTSCSGGSDNNYSFSYVAGSVQVGTATVTITAENKTVTYGATLSQSITVNGLANGDSIDSVIYTYQGTGVTSYSASTTRPVAAGNYSIAPSGVVLGTGSSSNYTFQYTAGTATINKKGVVITASSPLVTYGDAVPTVTAAYSNDFQYSDTASVVSGTSCTTTYTTSSNALSAPETSCSGATAVNYSFTYVAGVVSVAKKSIMVTASSHNVIYGDAVPTVAPSYDGFVNSQNSTVFTTVPTCTTGYVVTTGVGTIATTCSGGSATNYSFVFTAGVVTVGKKTLAVSAPSPTVTYGDASPTLTPTIGGFVNSETTSVLTTAPSCSSTYTSSSNAGMTPAVTCSGGVDDNYAFSYTAGAFTINRAQQSTVTVSATDSSLTWQPGPSYATTTLVGAGGDGDGGFTYSVTSTGSVCSIVGSTLTALTAGVCKLTATRELSTNFEAKTSAEFNYTIAKAAQTTTFATLMSKTYGDSSFAISASTSSGLTVAFVGTSGVCSVGAPTLSGGTSTATVSIVAAGSCTITSSQSGNINYNVAAAEVGSALSRTFTIAQKNLTITGATASSKVYDGTDTATGNVSAASLLGVSFSDDVSIKQTGFTATFSDANAADGKTVTFASVTLEGTKAANYSVTQPTTVANISKASAGLTWATPSAITYGTTLSSTQLNASASVAGSFTYTPTSGTLLDAGSRTLSVSFVPTSSNYAVDTRTVTLQVNQKPVTVTASNRGFVYGGSFTPGFAHSDLVGSDAPSAVTYTYTGTGSTAYSASTTAPVSRGTYSISPSAVVLSVGNTANYDFTYVDGLLSITQAEQAPIVVTAASQSLTYSPNPSPATTTLSMLAGSAGSGTGAVNYAVASGNTVCEINGSTLTALTAGACTVTVTRAADLNFASKTSDAITVTIAKAAQTVSFAAIADKVYGDAQFSVTPTATSGLTVAITSSDTSVCDVPSTLTIRIVNVGTCTIVAQQSGNINYETATAANGSSLTRSFTVTQKTLAVSGVSTVTRVYDASTSATSQLQFNGASLNGVIAGDTVTLESGAATGSYTSKNIGVNKLVTIAGLSLGGTHAARYTVQAPSGVVGTVTQATITTSGITVVSRNYDGTRNATLNTIGHSLGGVLGSDVVTLDASTYTATYDTATAAVSKAVTVSDLTLSGADSSNYNMQQPALVGVISKATATVSFTSSLTLVYNGSSRTVSTSTSPSALTVNVTYAGRGSTSYSSSATGPTNAGTYTVAASIVETNFLGSNSSNFEIDKQTVTVTLDNAALTTTFNGRARIVGATTTPSGKTIVVSYAGSGSTVYGSSTFAPTNAGSYAVTASVNEQNFQGAATQILTVAKSLQSALSIVNNTSATYGDTLALVAKGGSGNGAVTYSRVSGPCTVDSSTGSLVASGVGTCVVQAVREGSANYVAATSATRAIVVGRAMQSVSFTSAMPSNPAVGDTYTPTATATSGLTVSIVITAGEGTVCTRSNATITFVASGLCELTASQAGSASYEPATSVLQTIVVGKLGQSISFQQPARKRLGDPAFMLSASTSSGLNITYTLVSGGSVCGVTSAGLVTIAAVGTCAIAASQLGDSVYSAASTLTRDIVIVADVPTAPKITSVSGGDASITVGFTEPAINGGSVIVGYRLSARPASGSTATSSQCDLVARTCVVNGLVNGAEYTVSLAAVNAAGVGEDDVAPGTASPAPVLEAVRNVAGQRTDASMTITWEDPESYGDGSFDRYELSIRPEDGSFGTPVAVQSVEDHVMSMSADEQVHQLTSQSRVYTFTGLLNTKTYFVKIVTITTSRLAAAASNTAAATVLPLEAPSAPQDVTIESANGRSATVSWKAPLSDGGSPLTSYVVNPSSGTCMLATPLSTMCAVTGLTPGQSFSATVRAVNAIGQSATTTESAAMPDVPGAPSISTVTLSGTSALVTFAAPTSNGGRLITSYSVTAVNSKDIADVARCTTTSLSCLVNGMKGGTTYNFTVRARNGVGESTSSAVYSLAPPSPVVVTPTAPITRSTADASTVWQKYRAETSRVATGLVGLPPAPGQVKVAAAGSRTRVIASGTKATGGPITQALITIASKSGRTLARINVRVSSENPSATVTVPFKSASIKVYVQFANDYGVSTGGPVGVNVKEGNTYDSTVVAGKPQLMGSISGLPVYFNSGSAALTTAGMAELRKIATEVKQTTGLVYVTGYARLDEVRGWQVDVLSRARAEAVAKYLAKLGVRQWIRFQGAGALRSDWGDWRDRRVIVHAGGSVGVA